MRSGARLQNPVPNWLRAAPTDLNDEISYKLSDDPSAAAFDVFCTANFLNYLPWIASIEHLLSFGLESVAAHDQRLVQQLIDGLPDSYRLLSPREPNARSTLVLLTHGDTGRNHEVFDRLAEAGIDVALRGNNIRIAPHLYNSAREIDAVLEVLTDAA